LGIVIDRVGGISSFGGNEMQPVVTPMIEPIGSNFIQGYFLDEHNQPLFVLDSQGIINSFIHL
jgi:chemotaxis signal transduction protein